MTDTAGQWDPMSFIVPGFLARDNDGKWAEKHWLNVPGPFYTGQTDNCWTGRLHAPRHVLYGGEFYNEFVYRQPKSCEEVKCLIIAAEQDPFAGYACDGDSRWTPQTVRAWWRERDPVREHVMALAAEWTAEVVPERLEAAEGARDFLGYLADGLEADLRAYIFRLEHGHYPRSDDQLPDL